MPGRPHLILAGALAVAVLLPGCTGPVELPAPTPDPPTATLCHGLTAALPDTVLDQRRRTSSGGPLTAAWGRPAITLRCGVGAPVGLGPASPCLEVNGVGWFEQDQSAGSLFTTVGRAAYVEVAVPDRYAPESGALVDLAPAVAQYDPIHTPCVG